MKLRVKRTDMERLLVLCAAALVVVLALRGRNAPLPYEEDPTTVTTVTAPAETQAVTVFYQDGEGYLVPVTCQVEKTDGIAKAAVAMTVQSSRNDLQAARLGLKTTVPAGTSFDLDISDGKARLDVSKEALACQSAQEETLMVGSLAHTLLSFDTVKEVTFLFDGQKRSRLTHGTDVSGVFTGGALNQESVETMSSGGSSVLLYFPSASGRMLVPVTRTVFSDADLTTAMLELAKGPRSDSGLEAPLPKECGLLGVTMKNGVVTVNFTKEFLTAMESDAGKQTLRAVLFTASQFPGVKKVKIAVEGKEYQPPEQDAPTFLNDAEEIMTQYPGVVELD